MHTPKPAASHRRPSPPTQLRSLPESAVSAGSGGGTPVSSRALSAGSAAMWAIPFSELNILRPIGEGSFGRVYEAEWCAEWSG